MVERTTIASRGDWATADLKDYRNDDDHEEDLVVCQPGADGGQRRSHRWWKRQPQSVGGNGQRVVAGFRAFLFVCFVVGSKVQDNFLENKLPVLKCQGCAFGSQGKPGLFHLRFIDVCSFWCREIFKNPLLPFDPPGRVS